MRARAPGRIREYATSALAPTRARAVAALFTVLSVLLAAAGGPTTGQVAAQPAAHPIVITAAPDDTADDLAAVKRGRQLAEREHHQAEQTAAAAARAVARPARAVRADRSARARTARQTHREARAGTRVPARRARPARTARHLPFAAPANSGRAGVVIAFALGQVGKRYVYGTAGPDTYDCSGLVMRAFAQVGIRLPHQSGGIAGYGRSVPRGQWQPGDVLVYPGHVAIYLGGGQMVEAANQRVPVRRGPVWGSPTARRLL